MVLQHISVGKSLLWHISYNNYFAQSRDFPTELCCNTIIISCFTIFVAQIPTSFLNLHFFKKILVIIGPSTALKLRKHLRMTGNRNLKNH